MPHGFILIFAEVAIFHGKGACLVNGGLVRIGTLPFGETGI